MIDVLKDLRWEQVPSCFCGYVDSEFAIYICLLCLYLMPRPLIPKSSTKYNWKIRSVYRVGDICRAKQGAHGMALFTEP